MDKIMNERTEPLTPQTYSDVDETHTIPLRSIDGPRNGKMTDNERVGYDVIREMIFLKLAVSRKVTKWQAVKNRCLPITFPPKPSLRIIPLLSDARARKISMADQVADHVGGRIEARVWGHIRERILHRVSDQVHVRVLNRVDHCVWIRVLSEIGNPIWGRITELLRRRVRD